MQRFAMSKMAAGAAKHRKDSRQVLPDRQGSREKLAAPSSRKTSHANETVPDRANRKISNRSVALPAQPSIEEATESALDLNEILRPERFKDQGDVYVENIATNASMPHMFPARKPTIVTKALADGYPATVDTFPPALKWVDEEMSQLTQKEVPLAQIKEFTDYFDAERARKLERRDMIKEHLKQHLMANWPTYSFATLIATGMFLFYIFETFIPVQLDSRVKSEDGCIRAHGFMGYLFFTLSATTTIGFGTIYPCNLVSRIFGIIFCAIGIPLTLVILTRVGDVVARAVHALHTRMPPKTIPQDNVAHGDSDSVESEAEEETPVPVSIGISFILIAVLLSAFYYMVIEHYWAGESVYYAFYTLIAGDLQVKNLRYSLFIFIIVILGFGMVATTYDIVQLNIMNMTKKMEKDVKRIQDAILAGELDLGDKTAEEMIQELLADRTPGWMKAAMTTNQLDSIVEKSVATLDKSFSAVGGNSVSVQVNPSDLPGSAERAMQCEKLVCEEERTVERTDEGAQAGSSLFYLADRGMSTDSAETSDASSNTPPKLMHDKHSGADLKAESSVAHTQVSPEEWFSRQDSEAQCMIREFMHNEVQTILEGIDRRLHHADDQTQELVDRKMQTEGWEVADHIAQVYPVTNNRQLQTVTPLLIDRHIQTLLKRLVDDGFQTDPTPTREKRLDTMDLISMRDQITGYDNAAMEHKETDTIDLLNFVMQSRPSSFHRRASALPVSYKY